MYDFKKMKFVKTYIFKDIEQHDVAMTYWSYHFYSVVYKS